MNKQAIILLTLIFLFTGCQKKELPVSLVDKHNVPMVLVPEGSFKMGIDNMSPLEGPSHMVLLDSFYIDQYEVTNARYAACVEAGVCAPPRGVDTLDKEYYENPNYSDFPVVFVTWDDANSYCQWRNARLPTEAEWEKAARGTDARIFPWGEELACKYANYGAVPMLCAGGPTEVGSYPLGVSPYGAYDMIGNVSEYTADWFIEDYHERLQGDDVNPLVADEPAGAFPGHTIRSGSWMGTNEHNQLRVTSRNNASLGSTGLINGFRCAKTP